LLTKLRRKKLPPQKPRLPRKQPLRLLLKRLLQLKRLQPTTPRQSRLSSNA
jgi:hypothetical protein